MTCWWCIFWRKSISWRQTWKNRGGWCLYHDVIRNKMEPACEHYTAGVLSNIELGAAVADLPDERRNAVFEAVRRNEP